MNGQNAILHTYIAGFALLNMKAPFQKENLVHLFENTPVKLLYIRRSCDIPFKVTKHYCGLIFTGIIKSFQLCNI